MKWGLISLALGTLFAGAGWMMAGSRPTNVVIFEPQTPVAGINQERHPVTPEMVQAAESLRKTPMPAFKLKDLDGVEVGEADFKDGKPSVIVFVKSGCPCSLEAQPIFNSIAKAFGGDARFYSMIDAEKVDAEAYSTTTVTPYRTVPDPDGKVIRQFKVLASASYALIDGKGEIVQEWAGYSKDTLRQLNYLLGTLSGVGPKEFDDSKAPEHVTAGCTFEFKK